MYTPRTNGLCFCEQNNQLLRELEQLRREKEQRERELEDENAELKGELAKIRAEMDAVLKELQTIVDTKLGLELEIAAYRKLLEGEENRYVTTVVGAELVIILTLIRMLTRDTFVA